jgi:hypothetical protein
MHYLKNCLTLIDIGIPSHVSKVPLCQLFSKVIFYTQIILGFVLIAFRAVHFAQKKTRLQIIVPTISWLPGLQVSLPSSDFIFLYGKKLKSSIVLGISESKTKNNYLHIFGMLKAFRFINMISAAFKYIAASGSRLQSARTKFRRVSTSPEPNPNGEKCQEVPKIVKSPDVISKTGILLVSLAVSLGVLMIGSTIATRFQWEQLVIGTTKYDIQIEKLEDQLKVYHFAFDKVLKEQGMSQTTADVATFKALMVSCQHNYFYW